MGFLPQKGMDTCDHWEAIWTWLANFIRTFQSSVIHVYRRSAVPYWPLSWQGNGTKLDDCKVSSGDLANGWWTLLISVLKFLGWEIHTVDDYSYWKTLLWLKVGETYILIISSHEASHNCKLWGCIVIISWDLCYDCKFVGTSMINFVDGSLDL